MNVIVTDARRRGATPRACRRPRELRELKTFPQSRLTNDQGKTEFPTGPSVEEVIRPLRSHGARVIMVSDVRTALRRGRTGLPLVKGVPEWLSPITAVIPGQLVAMRFAELRGLSLDRPRGLRKITLTV
jgi:hypothetical protein